MKKLLVSVLVLSMTILATSCGTTPKTEAPPAEAPKAEAPKAEAPKEEVKMEKLVVGLDENFPPMGFRDDKGELVGFDIDLAKEAGKRMGIEMEFQPINWKSKELELNSNKVDLLWNGLTITDARKETMLFSDPYLENKQIVMVKNDSAIQVKEDLKGKNIGIQKDSSAVDAVKAEPEISDQFKEIFEFDDNIKAFLDLDIGRVDAVVVDEIVAKYYLAQNKTDFRILEEDFGDELYGVAMRKDDTELAAKLKKALDEMKADGGSAEISKKWFGEDIVVK